VVGHPSLGKATVNSPCEVEDKLLR
jgi:hypothetical protein